MMKASGRIEVRKCKYIILFIIISQSILNYINYVGIWNLYLYCNPLYRIFDFLIGMFTAKIILHNSNTISEIRKKNTYVEFVIILVFIFQYLISFIVFDNMAYYSILFSFALYYLSKEEGYISQKILVSKALQKLASISFEFYMVHELILIFFRKVFSNVEVYWVIKCIIIAIPSFLISLGLAFIMNKYITKKV